MVKVIEVSSDLKSAVVGLGNSQAALLTTTERKQTKTETVDPDSEIESTTSISPWGADNLFPQNLIKKTRPSTVVASTIDKIVRFMISGGLIWGKVKGFNADGTEVIEPATGKKDYNEIREFLDRINIDAYLERASTDAYWFWNFFPTFIKNTKTNKIVNLDLHRSWECRYGWRNQTTGLIEKVYVNAAWEALGGNLGNFSVQDNVKDFDVVNADFNAAAQVKRAKKAELIYPLSLPSVGSKYYQLAPWDSICSGGWLDFALEIPKFKKSLMQNQITVKYHIEIEEGWWEWKFPGFNKMEMNKRKKIMADELSNFMKIMSGSDNAGNVIISTFKRDAHSLKEYASWKITPIDNKLKDGVLNADSQESSNHILYAFGVDPTIIGGGPGKTMGAGSGSDKRVAYNMQVISMKPIQDKIVSPLNVIRDVNGWDTNIRFWFRNYYLATLDQTNPENRI